MIATSKAMSLLAAAALLAACGQQARQTIDTEQTNTAEREQLINAVEQHPSMTDPSQASAPVVVPTTIPPPAPDGVSVVGHDDHGGMNHDMSAETNQEALQNGN